MAQLAGMFNVSDGMFVSHAMALPVNMDESLQNDASPSIASLAALLSQMLVAPRIIASPRIAMHIDPPSSKAANHATITKPTAVEEVLFLSEECHGSSCV